MNKKIKLFLVIAIIFTLIVILIFQNRNTIDNEYATDKINVKTKNHAKDITVIIEKQIKEYPKEQVLESYKGYDVCAKIEIPSLSLKANILSEFSNEALKVSCTKFWGVQPNQEGNFCVAGHNTKNMFLGIKNLQLGDTFFITDNIVGKVEYEIFNIDKVEPKNVECLDAVTIGEKEVTLITCTKDSKHRIIIKAREKVTD